MSVISKRRGHNENDVTMTLAGLWRYGDLRHVATGCNTLVDFMVIEWTLSLSIKVDQKSFAYQKPRIVTALHIVCRHIVMWIVVCRPYGCPCPGAMCHWSGSITEVLQHLSTQHSTITTLLGLCRAGFVEYPL